MHSSPRRAPWRMWTLSQTLVPSPIETPSSMIAVGGILTIFRFPLVISFLQTPRARAKTRRHRRFLVGEKHALFDVMSSGEPSFRARAIERPVNFVFLVSAESAFGQALVGFTVRGNERVG